MDEIKILSLSGGGFRGYYSALVLEAWEEKYGRLANHFDLIAGTSVGGIVALGLAAGKSATAIKEIFEVSGAEIFSDRSRPQSALGQIRDIFRYLNKAKYDPSSLRLVLESMFGDMKMGDLAHRTIIPAVNLNDGSTRVFKTPHHASLRIDQHISVVDVALATSAAPTYFPAVKVSGEVYADGGIFANTPDLLAIHEAGHFFNLGDETISIVSVGTTRPIVGVSSSTDLNMGLVQWLQDQRLINAVMNSQEAFVRNMLEHRLGDRYIRIDALQSTSDVDLVSLDTATSESRDILKGLANKSIREFSNNPILTRVLSDVVEACIFPGKD